MSARTMRAISALLLLAGIISTPAYAAVDAGARGLAARALPTAKLPSALVALGIPIVVQEASTSATLSGVINRDSQLFVSVGGAVPASSYQWQRNTNGSYVNIPGATAATYAPNGSDGVNIRCQAVISGQTITTAPAQYLGQVATRSFLPNNITQAAGTAVSTTLHYSRQALTQLQVVYGNWAVETSSSTPPGGGYEVADTGNLNYQVSVQYPVGTKIGNFTFSGSSQGVLDANVRSEITSDVLRLPVTIPAGAQFALQVTVIATTGFPYTKPPQDSRYTSSSTVIAGESLTNNGAAQTDAAIYPLAIIAPTQAVSIGLVGDSRSEAQGSSPNAAGDTGEMAMSLGPMFAYINLSVASDRSAFWTARAARRLGLLRYVSHAIFETGINDINGGGNTAAQTMVYDSTVLGLIGNMGRPTAVTTLSPVSTSSSDWSTVAAQTTASLNAARVSINQARRAGNYYGSFISFDTAGQVENVQDSGIWKPSLTFDGLHENLAGYSAIQNSGVTTPGSFTR